jgi:hypothetical protein
MINQTSRDDLGAYKHTTKEEKKKIVPVFLCGGKTYLSTVAAPNLGTVKILITT